MLCLNLSAVNINRVGKCLKGIKGNTDRKCQLQKRQRMTRQRSHTLQHKIRIFEETKDSDIDNNRQHKHPFAVLRFLPAVKIFHDDSVGVIKHRGKQHDHDISRLSPRIEKQTRNKQKEIAESHRAKCIYCQHHRQKSAKKHHTAKNHYFCPLYLLNLRDLSDEIRITCHRDIVDKDHILYVILRGKL